LTGTTHHLPPRAASSPRCGYRFQSGRRNEEVGGRATGEERGIIARKLLFTVGAHEGLKSGSETGRKGVAGKGGEEEGRKTPPGHPNGRSEARFSGSSARKWVAWREILKRENTVSPSQAKENRRGSENFCGTGSSNSVEAGNQDATVAERDFNGFQRQALVVPVGWFFC
jgi:hypothetical protein